MKEKQEKHCKHQYSHTFGAGVYYLDPDYTDEHQTIRSRTTGRDVEIGHGGPKGNDTTNDGPGGLVSANPFSSLAQAHFLHAHPSILGKKGLAEWDAATKGKHLPKHVKKS